MTTRQVDWQVPAKINLIRRHLARQRRDLYIVPYYRLPRAATRLVGFIHSPSLASGRRLRMPLPPFSLPIASHRDYADER